MSIQRQDEGPFPRPIRTTPSPVREAQAPPGWSAEFNLVLALLRNDAGVSSLAAGIEADSFLKTLSRHRLALALAPAATLTELPAALRHALARRQQRLTLRAMERCRQLHELIRALEEAGIAACAIKGPAFAALFGDPTWREAADLDVLIRAGDLLPALDRLERLGYRLVETDRAGLRSYLAVNHALLLRQPGTSGDVELHLRLGNTEGQFPAKRFDPWRRRIGVEIAGLPVPTLDPVAAVIYAVYHGAKHNWHRLFWLVDIARVMRNPHFDWASAMALARDMGLERQMMMAVLLAHRLLGVDLPWALRDRHRLIRVVTPLAAALIPYLDDLPSDRGGDLAARLGLGRYLMRLFALQSNWRGRLGLIGFLLAATDQDRGLVRLPPGLGWAYPGIRLCRLAIGYSFRRRGLRSPIPVGADHGKAAKP